MFITNLCGTGSGIDNGMKVNSLYSMNHMGYSDAILTALQEGAAPKPVNFIGTLNNTGQSQIIGTDERVTMWNCSNHRIQFVVVTDFAKFDQVFTRDNFLYWVKGLGYTQLNDVIYNDHQNTSTEELLRCVVSFLIDRKHCNINGYLPIPISSLKDYGYLVYDVKADGLSDLTLVFKKESEWLLYTPSSVVIRSEGEYQVLPYASVTEKQIVELLMSIESASQEGKICSLAYVFPGFVDSSIFCGRVESTSESMDAAAKELKVRGASAKSKKEKLEDMVEALGKEPPGIYVISNNTKVSPNDKTSMVNQMRFRGRNSMGVNGKVGVCQVDRPASTTSLLVDGTYAQFSAFNIPPPNEKCDGSFLQFSIK